MCVTGGDAQPPACVPPRLAGRVRVNHSVATPAGDDSALLVQVDVENTGRRAQNFTWAEVWGSLMLHQDPAWAKRQK